MDLLEKRIVNKINPLEINEIQKELNLRFERLNEREYNRNSDGADDQALFMFQFKGKCCNCGKLGHKEIQCTLRREQERKRDDGVPITCNYCKKPDHTNANCFQLLRRNENGQSNPGATR